MSAHPHQVGSPGGKAVAGSDAPPLAGRSIVPALRKDGTAPHEFLYFNHNNNRALRVGDWKLIATGETGKWELCDMKKDRSEQHDLAAEQPARVNAMAAQWKALDDEFVRVREAAPASGKKRMAARA